MTNVYETVLTAQEKRARIIIDRAYDAFIEIDINNVIVDWNTRAEITFGWTREDVVGKLLADVIIPVRYHEIQSRELKQFRTQAAVQSTISNKQIEIFVLRRDGQEFPAEMTVFPVPCGNSINLGAFIRNISGSKIAERALNESEENFRLLISGVTDYAIIMLDPQGVITTWNEGAQRINGYTANEIIGKHFSQFYSSGDNAIEVPKRVLETAIKYGRYEEDEQRIRKDSNPFWANTIINPIYNQDGKLAGFAEVTRDISKWKAADQDFRRLLELAPDAMVVVNQLGNIVLVNSQTENIFGFDRKELIGQTVEKLIPDRSRFLAQRHTRSVSTGLELYALRKDGTEFPVEISLSPLETEEGLLVSSAIRDISERKQLESDLHKQKELFQIILDSLTDGVVVADNEGRFLVINQAAQRMTGIDYIEVPIDKWSEQFGLYLPDTITPYPTQDLPLVQAMRGQTVIEAEMFIRNSNMPYGAYLNVNGAPMEIGNEGSKVGVIVFRDVSKHKEAEQKQLHLAEELKRSNAELQQFASVASHDLQEPLRGVAGCLEIIEETYKGKLDDKVDKLIRHAIDGSMRMHALIDDLLSLSRVTTIEMTIQPADMSIVLDRALENLEVPIKESQAIITRDNLSVLAVDSTHLIQLFQNLISNAIKFRADRPLEIYVGAKCEDGQWLFFVRDNGIGFKQEYTNQIFLPFKRLHSKDKYPGTGIGLPICKRIVERHGGNIWAESEFGQGATFYFTISDLKGNHD